MTKTEAAKALGVSERTLNRYVENKRLTVTYKKGKTNDVAVFDEAEVLRLKAEIETPPAVDSTTLAVSQPDGDPERIDGYVMQVIEHQQQQIDFLQAQLEEANRNAEAWRSAFQNLQEQQLKALAAPATASAAEPPSEAVSEPVAAPESMPEAEELPPIEAAEEEAESEPEVWVETEPPVEPETPLVETETPPVETIAPIEETPALEAGPEPKAEPKLEAEPTTPRVSESNSISPALYGAQKSSAASTLSAPPTPPGAQPEAPTPPSGPLTTPWYPPQEEKTLWRRFKVWLVGG